MYLKKLQNESFLIYKKIKNIFFIRAFLSIGSVFYFLAYKTRLLFYKYCLLKTEKVSATVISIGNLTCGGTGKTPLTMEIAKHLIAKNVPKAIVLSGSDRIFATQSAIKLGAEILILDDGFQYLKLHRDKNILILDNENPFDNGYLLPAGELRELPDSIKRATSIVLSNSKDSKSRIALLNKLKKYTCDKPIIEMNYKIKNLKGINIVKTIAPQELKDKKVIIFSGIGNPKAFSNSIHECGLEVVEHLIFTDHHNYEINDLSKIIDLAIKNKIENIITTEKDAIKLEYSCESAPVTFWHSVLEITWNTSDPFNKLLNNLVSNQAVPTPPDYGEVR